MLYLLFEYYFKLRIRVRVAKGDTKVLNETNNYKQANQALNIHIITFSVFIYLVIYCRVTS